MEISFLIIPEHREKNYHSSQTEIVFKGEKSIMPIASQKSPETSAWHFIGVRSYLRHLVFI